MCNSCLFQFNKIDALVKPIVRQHNFYFVEKMPLCTLVKQLNISGCKARVRDPTYFYGDFGVL